MMEPTCSWLAEASIAAERDEQACLGAALANDEAAQVVARELESGQFALDSHRRIHTALASLVGRGEGVDVLTVAAEVERTSGWEGVRARGYLDLLAESTLVAGHVREYCTRVVELARHCELRQRLERVRESAAGLTLNDAARSRLRTELDAARVLVDGGLAAGEGLRLYDGPELATMALDEPQALCEGLIYRGCSTDLVAEPKRGKTTLLLDVTARLTAGERWCERLTAQAAVLYLSEQSPYSFNPQCARAHLLGEARFHVVFHRDALALSWGEIGELVLRAAKAHEIDLVVVDNLSLWAGISGEQENDAGVALETLRVIERMTGAGLGVVAVRHARKSGGTISEAGRGSSAIAGGFDVLAQLKGDVRPQRRILAVTGRVFAEEPRDLVIELGHDGRYHFLGEGDLIARHDARRAILELVPQASEDALGEAEIIAACQAIGLGKPTVQKVLRELCDGEDACLRRAHGAGAASKRAYGYWRASDAA